MCFGAPLILISQILQFFQALLKTSSLGSSQYVEPEHDSEPPEKTLAPDQARVWPITSSSIDDFNLKLQR